MRPNVVLSTSLLVLSPLIFAIENAQVASDQARQSPSITVAKVRRSPPSGHWHRQDSISETHSESDAPNSTTATSETPASSSEAPSTAPPTSTTTTPPPTSTTNSTPANTPHFSSPSLPVSGLVSTAPNGGVTTIIQTVTNSGSATSSSASASSTDGSDDNSGVGTKSIAGIAVAGSLAVLGIAGFIWWKMSKKRFSGLEDTDDNFKWPDLNDNTALQPLPGRAESIRGGRDGAVESAQSESNPAKPYYDNQSAMSSVADLSRGPMEHAESALYYDNPAQYPNYQHSAHAVPSDSASGYYDPYSGPVPEAFSPQTATGPSFAADPGRRSPGPNNAYDAGAYGPRAASPGPNAAYAPRSASPGPSLAYGGPRAASPGPNMAFGEPRSASPGPNAAYAPPSASPGPGAAYAAYGARSASPGPNYPYGGRTSAGPNNFGQQ